MYTFDTLEGDEKRVRQTKFLADLSEAKLQEATRNAEGLHSKPGEGKRPEVPPLLDKRTGEAN